MRRFFASIILFYGLIAPAFAEQFFGTSGPLSIPFQSMQMWGGGLNTKQAWAANTGVHFMAPDGGAFYMQSSVDGFWYQQYTDLAEAPAACNTDSTPYTVLGSCFSIYPTSGTTQTQAVAMNQGGGTIGACGSPVDSTIAYAYQFGFIFKSTNVNKANPSATKWINTRQISGDTTTPFPHKDGPNVGNPRLNGPYIVCDPNSALQFYVGTQQDGLFFSQDGGGHLSQVSTSDIPLSTPLNSTGGNSYITAFDPASGTTGGFTNTVCTTSNPTGVYCSILGGAAGSWILQSTGTLPVNPVNHIMFTPATGAGTTGVLWAFGDTGGLYKLSAVGGTWTTVVAPGATTAAWFDINPLNNQQIIIIDSGVSLYVALNGAASLTDFTKYAPSAFNGGDAPWTFSKYNPGTGPSLTASFPLGFNVAFDPVNNGKIFASMGQTSATTTLPNAPFTWTVNVKGVMHATGGSIISPTANTVITGSQDIGGCALSTLSAPTNCFLSSFSQSLSFGSSFAVDVKDPTYVAAKIQGNTSAGFDLSGYSRDNFQTQHFFNNWEAFIVANGVVSGTNIISSSPGGSPFGSGKTRITLPSPYTTTSPALTSWTNGQGDYICALSTLSQGANALNNTGTSCYRIAVIDSITFDMDVAFASNFSQITDRNGVPGNYWLWRSTSITSNWSGRRNITSIANDGGKIQVCVFDTGGGQNGFILSIPVDITGVVDSINGLASIANGHWTVAQPSSGTFTTTGCFDLLNSDATAGGGLGTYVSGGQAKTFVEPGGAMAVSGNNIVIAASDNGSAWCSTDKGTSKAGWINIDDVATLPFYPVATTVNGSVAGGATRIVVTDGTKIGASVGINIPMSDGRNFYGITEGNLSIASGTYNNATGDVVLTLAVATGGLTNDQIKISAVTGTGPAIASINGTFASPTVSGGGLTITYNIGAGIGVTTINSGVGTFFESGNAIPMALIASRSPASRYAVPSTLTIANGANITKSTHGWVANVASAHNVTADWVTSGTFHLTNTSVGLIKWVNCGTPVVVNNIVSPNGWQLGAGSNATPRSVPGQSGHFFYVSGTSGATAISTQTLYRSCNGNNSTVNLTNMEAVTGFYGAAMVGFGATFSGKSYPAIIVAGYYDPTIPPSEANATWGIWRSIDDPNAGVNGVCLSGTGSTKRGTFQFLAPWPSAFANKGQWMLQPLDLTGDPAIPGYVYFSGPGTAFYGSFPYLLKRDLDPAANDNSPVFLNIAA